MSNVGVEPIFIQETHISLPSAFLMISGTRNLTFSIFHYLYPPCTWGTYLFFIIVVWMFFRGEYSLQTCRWSWSEPNGCGNANLCFLKNHILHFFFFFAKEPSSLSLNTKWRACSSNSFSSLRLNSSIYIFKHYKMHSATWPHRFLSHADSEGLHNKRKRSLMFYIHDQL